VNNAKKDEKEEFKLEESCMSIVGCLSCIHFRSMTIMTIALCTLLMQNQKKLKEIDTMWIFTSMEQSVAHMRDLRFWKISLYFVLMVNEESYKK